MPQSLLIFNVISKVTKLKMGIYHHLLFINWYLILLFELGDLFFVSQISVNCIISLIKLHNCVVYLDKNNLKLTKQSLIMF